MTYTPRYTTVAYVQAKTGLSNTEVDLTQDNNVRMTIEDAENEVEYVTGRQYTNANAITQYISVNQMDLTGNAQTKITLSHFPIQSITQFQILDIDDNPVSTFATLSSAQIAAGTFDTVDYWLSTQVDPLTFTATPMGTITLKTQTFPQGTNNVQIAYTYGYASVPVAVRDLATCLSGIRLWVIFLGGQYNRFNSYSIPSQSANKGDFYQRGQQNISMLRQEADMILDRVGRKLRTTWFATGGDR